MLRRICIVVVLIILIAFVGFFTSAETAYLSLPRVKLRNMLDEKRPRAKIVAKLKKNMDRLLTTVLIGTNFLNSLASALATALAIEILGGSKLANLTPFITAFFITTFGQIVPKTAAGLYPEAFTCFSSIPLMILQKLIFPIVWLFERFSHLAVFFAEKVIKPTGPLITEEELKTLIYVGESEGTIEKDESRMLNKIIKFNDISANDMMKHRNFLDMISSEASYDEVIQLFLENGHSNLVVYNGDTENVVGVLNYKSVLYRHEKKDDFDSTASGFAGKNKEEVIFVPGTLSALELLAKFRNAEHKFAIVLGEQGQISGIITMEDIMRVVFNRMTDEDNYDDLPPESRIKLVSANVFVVPGDLKLDDVNEILHLQLHSENVNTIGGWVLEKFGHLPSVGEVVINNKNLFIVEDVVQRRITQVKINIKN